MEVQIRTQKPNLLRSWFRHIKTGCFQKYFSRIIAWIKNISFKANKTAKNFRFRAKKIKISHPSLPLNNFIFRHIGLFILVSMALISNFLAAKGSDIILEDLISEVSLSESAAISEGDLESLVSKISQYTPIIQENPQKVTNRLTLKDQIMMTDGQYVSKPSVLVTLKNGEETSSQPVAQTAEKPRQIITYPVQGGDTLAAIAGKFGISIVTIKEANNLNSDIISPGQKLTILPADGIVHVVKKGESLSNIVSIYQGDLHKTIQENGLGQADRIFAGQKIVIIGGKKPAPASVKVVSSADKKSQVSGIKVNRNKGPNHFPFGWCTWYVASRRYVPWNGNASAWPSQARRLGFRVGGTPAVGAILVTRESRWGHVAYVESVHGGTVTISEMNFNRWGRVNWRTVPASYGMYIY